MHLQSSDKTKKNIALGNPSQKMVKLGEESKPLLLPSSPLQALIFYFIFYLFVCLYGGMSKGVSCSIKWCQINKMIDHF